MALIKSCCCCSLRTGTLIIGWLELIGGILGMIVTIIMMAVIGSVKVELDKTTEVTIKGYNNETGAILAEEETTTETVGVGKGAYAFMILVLIGMFIYYMCFTILSTFLIIGVRKENMRYVKLWVQIKTVLLILAFIGITLQLFLMLFDVDSSVKDQIIIAVIDGLLIMVVQSYYEQVTESTVPTY